MATIAKQRPYSLEYMGICHAPVKFLPTAGSMTWSPGDLAIAGTNVIEHASDIGENDIDVSAEDVVGILEQSGASLAEGTKVAVTLVLPGHFYEFTYEADSSSTDARLASHDTDDVSGGGYAICDTTISEGVLNVLDYVGELDEFETHSFIAQGGTSETSGATNQPSAHEGVDEDTNPRVICTFTQAAMFFV